MITLTDEQIHELCDMAEGDIGGRHPDDMPELKRFVADMRKQLLALNRGHRTMYRVLQEMQRRKHEQVD